MTETPEKKTELDALIQKKGVLFRDEEIKNIKMEKAKGVYLWDSTGKKYMDCAAGTFNLSLGSNHDELIEHVKEQCSKMVHLSSSYLCEPVLELGNKLVEISPENLNRVTTKVSGGSTANEGAIKLAQCYTGKGEVISYFRSHVGQTAFTQTVSGLAFRKQKFHFSQHGVIHISFPYCYRCPFGQKEGACSFSCVDAIYDQIHYGSSGNVACLIIEPILGNGGNVVAPREYMKRLEQLCKEEGIVLIFDEVQTGLGRTGEMFAADYFDVRPNIMSVAKGLGGSGFQIAAILMEERFNIMESIFHSFTYGSNVLSCSAGVKTIEIISRPGFLENVRTTGDYIMSRLRRFEEQYSFIGDVRGVGLMIGVELVKSKQTKEPNFELTNAIAKKAFEMGLLLRTSLYGKGNVFKIRPSLNITMEECEEMMDKLEAVLNEF